MLIKAGDKVRLAHPDLDDIMYGLEKGEEFEVVRIDDNLEHVFVDLLDNGSPYCLVTEQVEKVVE